MKHLNWPKLTILIALTACLGTALAQGAPMKSLHLLLPPVIPALPGRECNLYFDNLILAPPGVARLLEVDVDCAKGQQQNERFTWTPEPDELGDFPLSIKFTDADGNICAQGQTTIRVHPADAGRGRTITLLIVGDSGTHANVYPAELLELCRGDSNPALTQIGTFAPNPALPLVRHEGYGGWAAATFLTMWGPHVWDPTTHRGRSPFLYEKDGQPTLDFQKYCDDNNGGRGPDFILIWLGGNDHFAAKDDTIEASCSKFEANMDILMAEFRRVRPDTKIGIVTMLPPTATQDGFGANYGCGQTRWQYRKNQHRVVEREYAKWGDQEARNISIVPGFVNLDCVHGYPAVTQPANARSEVQIGRGSNGLHSTAAGYRQLADTIYCWLKGQLAH
jgi:lysophospholipase L1-like esterase